MPVDRTIPERRNHAWFPLADAERCRLFCCSLTDRDTRHVEEQDAFENTLPEQEHGRPTAESGMTHHVEEKKRRFAGEITEWLQKRAGAHRIDRLVVLAPARMLAALRKVPSGSLKGHFEVLQGDLMRLEAGQLAEHPKIRDLVRTTDEL